MNKCANNLEQGQEQKPATSSKSKINKFQFEVAVITNILL